MWLGCISAILNMPRLGCYLSSLLLRFWGWIDAILETSYELLCYVYIYIQYIIWLYAYCFIQSIYTQRSMLQLCTCRFVSVSKCTYLSEYQDLNSPAVSSNRCPLSTFPYLSSSSTISAYFLTFLHTHPNSRHAGSYEDVGTWLEMIDPWADDLFQHFRTSECYRRVDSAATVSEVVASVVWRENEGEYLSKPNVQKKLGGPEIKHLLENFHQDFWWFVGRWSFREEL